MYICLAVRPAIEKPCGGAGEQGIPYARLSDVSWRHALSVAEPQIRDLKGLGLCDIDLGPAKGVTQPSST